MLAVNGYYDGNVCVIKEKISVQPQEVITSEIKTRKHQAACLVM
jgi:hypothetical protein